MGTQLEPAPSKIKAYRRQLAEKREKAKVAYDKFHRTKSLPDLKGEDEVWVTDMKKHATVTGRAKEPRSYWLQTEGRRIRRNRRFLVVVQEATTGETCHVDKRNQQHEDEVWNYVAALNIGGPSEPSNINGIRPISARGGNPRRESRGAEEESTEPEL